LFYQENMRKLIVLLAALSVMPLFCEPAILVLQPKIDLGRLAQYTSKPFSVSVRNTGNSELRIIKVTTSCDCSKVISSPGKIAPGAEADIRLIFSSDGYEGPLERIITIESNDKKNPSAKSVINVDVFREFSTDPETISFERIVKRFGERKKLTLTYYRAVPVNITKIEYNRNTLDVSLEKPAGNAVNGNAAVLDIRIKPNLPIRTLNEKITIRGTAGGIEKEYAITVFGIVYDEDLYCEPCYVKMNDPESRKRTPYCLVKSSRSTPFKIVKVECDNRNLSVTPKPVTASEYRIEVEALNGLSAPGSVTRIRITTDYPYEPPITLDVFF
jgi:hypothetical protein